MAATAAASPEAAKCFLKAIKVCTVQTATSQPPTQPAKHQASAAEATDKIVGASLSLDMGVSLGL